MDTNRICAAWATVALAATTPFAAAQSTPAATPAANTGTNTATNTAGSGAAQRIEIVGSAPLAGAGIRRSQLPGAIQALSGDDLRDSQALDLSELLSRRLAGVHVNELAGNPLQMDVSFRGFAASPLLGTPQGLAVVMDGVRMNAPFGDVVSWDLIPRNALAQVSLLPGSQPVFGLNSLGGALVLETHDGRSHPGGDAALTAGGASRVVLDMAWGTRLGNATATQGFDAFLAAQAFKEKGWREASSSRQAQLFGKLSWRSGESSARLTLAHSQATLHGLGLQEGRWLAQDWGSVFTKPDETRNRSSLLSLAGTWAASAHTVLSGQVYARRLSSNTLNGDVNEGALDQNLYFNPTAANVAVLQAAGRTGYPTVRETAANTPFPYWNCIRNAVVNEEPNEKCTGLINRTQTEQSVRGLGLQATFKQPLLGLRNQLVLGAAFERARVAFEQNAEFGVIMPNREVLGVGVLADGTQDSEDAFDATVDLKSKSSTQSLYFSNTLSLSAQTHLTFGARMNRQRVSMVDQLDPTGTTGTLNGQHRFSGLNPMLGIVAPIGTAVVAHAQIGQSRRAPTATELGCADPADPCRLPNSMASDPPLLQVRTRSAELGLRSAAGAAWGWNISLWRADNQDDILFVAAQTAGTGYFRNVAATRRQGMDLSLQSPSFALGAWGSMNVGASWSLLDARFRSAEELLAPGNSSNEAAQDGFPGIEDDAFIEVQSGDRLPLLPRHVFKLNLQWQPSASVGLGLEWQASSGMLARGNENQAHQADGRLFLGPGRSVGYGLLHFSAAWALRTANASQSGLEFTARVNNLLNKRYTTAAVLGATPYNANGGVDARQVGSYSLNGETVYAVRHSTLFAPGAPRQAFVGLRLRWN